VVAGAVVVCADWLDVAAGVVVVCADWLEVAVVAAVAACWAEFAPGSAHATAAVPATLAAPAVIVTADSRTNPRRRVIPDWPAPMRLRVLITVASSARR
jgi:hypothetical protein